MDLPEVEQRNKQTDDVLADKPEPGKEAHQTSDRTEVLKRQLVSGASNVATDRKEEGDEGECSYVDPRDGHKSM